MKVIVDIDIIFYVARYLSKLIIQIAVNGV
jgi:hypothetical protein